METTSKDQKDSEIIIIAALSKNYVIGKAGTIPWYLPEDFKRFKQLTLGHPCIMGDVTYESLPEKSRPLPNRENIVLTFNHDYHPAGVIVEYSLEDALRYCQLNSIFKNQGNSTIFENNPPIDYTKIYLCGGGSVYRQALPLADKLEITLVDKIIADGDTFFPPINYSEWEQIYFEEKINPKDNLKFYFLTYVRK